MGVGSPGWIILGTPFRCRGVPAAARNELETLLRGFPAAGDEPGSVELTVEPDGAAGLALTDGRGARWILGDPLSSHLEYRLVNEAIRCARDRWVLHAGAVASAAGTCLIVGESGAGKTSLTLWLWASGLRLGTDDLCPIRQVSLAPEMFPRALHMDHSYSPRLLERIPPRPPSYPWDFYPFPDPGGAPVLPPVNHLLVLERGAGPEGEIEPLGQSEAAHHLLRAVIRSPGFDFGRALEDAVRLASRCRAHRLRAATPEAAGERAQELLSSL